MDTQPDEEATGGKGSPHVRDGDRFFLELQFVVQLKRWVDESLRGKAARGQPRIVAVEIGRVTRSQLLSVCNENFNGNLTTSTGEDRNCVAIV